MDLTDITNKHSLTVAFLSIMTLIFASVSCYLDSGISQYVQNATVSATQSGQEQNATVTTTQNAQEQNNATVSAIQALNVRVLPWHRSPVSGTLLSGTSVALLGRCTGNGWRRITSGTVTGWVNADYLDKGCE
jgi:uncharacterized protein YraI